MSEQNQSIRVDKISYLPGQSPQIWKGDNGGFFSDGDFGPGGDFQDFPGGLNPFVANNPGNTFANDLHLPVLGKTTIHQTDPFKEIPFSVQQIPFCVTFRVPGGASPSVTSIPRQIPFFEHTFAVPKRMIPPVTAYHLTGVVCSTDNGTIEADGVNGPSEEGFNEFSGASKTAMFKLTRTLKWALQVGGGSLLDNELGVYIDKTQTHNEWYAPTISHEAVGNVYWPSLPGYAQDGGNFAVNGDPVGAYQGVTLGNGQMASDEVLQPLTVYSDEVTVTFHCPIIINPNYGQGGGSYKIKGLATIY